MSGLADIHAKIEGDQPLSLDDGVRLYESPDIHTLGELANLVRERRHGDHAYYNVNQHINYTNYCVLRCKFCSFYRPYPKAGVAGYVSLAAETPNTIFLEKNPAADADGDGTLSTLERHYFMTKLAADSMSRVFEKHPEADLDGDGTLTKRELHEFFMKQAYSGAFGLEAVEGGSAGVFMHKSGQTGVVVQTTEDEPK